MPLAFISTSISAVTIRLELSPQSPLEGLLPFSVGEFTFQDLQRKEWQAVLAERVYGNAATEQINTLNNTELYNCTGQR